MTGGLIYIHIYIPQMELSSSEMDVLSLALGQWNTIIWVDN